MHELGPRPRLAAVSPGGSERMHTLPRGADVTSLAVHDDGACVLVRRGYAYELRCLDGDARVRWARRLPKEATSELVVDADGRLYLAMVDGVVAVDPSGAVAWRWTGEPPHGGTMMIAGPEVCFFADPPRPVAATTSRAWADPGLNLVCLSRRQPS